MKKELNINKKGFTLIELLAVIVILGVLLAIAIPSVTKYINSSKQSAFVDDAKSIVKSVSQEATSSRFSFPVNGGEATIVGYAAIQDELESGGQQSSYGYKYRTNNSCVIIVNSRSAEDPHYDFYVVALDEKGYGIGYLNEDDNTLIPGPISNSKLSSSNILQFGENATGFDCTAAVDNKITVYSYNDDGTVKSTSVTVTSTTY